MKKTLFVVGRCGNEERVALDLMARICGPSWTVEAEALKAADLDAAELAVFALDPRPADAVSSLAAACGHFTAELSALPCVLCSFGGALEAPSRAAFGAALGAPAAAVFDLAEGSDAYRRSALEAAQAIRDLRDEGARARLPAAALERRIDDFLAAHRTCALATALPDGSPRVTPIEYLWREGSFWFFSEGGLKFAGLETSARVSLCVYDEYASMAKVRGLQITGRAELVPEGCEDWRRAFAARGIKPEALAAQGLRLNLIRARPELFELLDASLRAEGFDSRQLLSSVTNLKGGSIG
jgi:nitroimidazol reductase NimA-like FMN-containing flavoprotein (pyridoxamine 5'-phosphate oxidase superfamily)